MKNYDYQYRFSESYKDRLYNEPERAQKARKILAILRDHLGPDLSQLSAVDFGCSTGIMSALLGSNFRHLTGIDIDEPAIAFARERFASDRVEFVLGDAMDTQLPGDHFDVAICAHVYEHVPESQRLVDEIHR